MYAPMGDGSVYEYVELWYGFAVKKESDAQDYAVEFLRFMARQDELNTLASIKGVSSAAIVAMVFFSAVFAARAPAMGNSADRAWQLSQLVEGVSTAFNPSHGSLSYVQAGHCVSKQIGRHDAACQGCPRCVSRSPEAHCFRVVARAVRVSQPAV